jgi:hypothetical protein
MHFQPRALALVKRETTLLFQDLDADIFNIVRIESDVQEGLEK